MVQRMCPPVHELAQEVGARGVDEEDAVLRVADAVLELGQVQAGVERVEGGAERGDGVDDLEVPVAVEREGGHDVPGAQVEGEEGVGEALAAEGEGRSR